ncbi:MAG TPA: hypothetical protein VFC53_09265 [Dehalococcoidia bacterium]|nr:hypothetical protein [Dehalococcoidia bacterium]
MFPTKNDSLLTLMYLLFSWVTVLRPPWADVAKAYSRELLSDIEGFHFDADFLNVVQTDRAKHDLARKGFEGHTANIEEQYTHARALIGL